MNDERTRDRQRDDLPGPAEDRDTGTTGTADERSSENRRKGLEKDLEDETVSDHHSDRHEE
jgi:hypothetical protein